MRRKLNTILFIDDDFSMFIENFSVLNKSFDFDFQAFDNIRDGLQYFAANQNEIGAILLDLSFSSSNYEGVDALHEIKKKNALLPVLMLTGSQSEKDLKRAVDCMRDGAFNYVGKTDLDPVSLFKMLKVAIDQYKVNSNAQRYNLLKEDYRNRLSGYEQMLHTSEMVIKNTLKDKLMFRPTFEKRIKDFNSFYDKILSKEELEGPITNPFERITDIAGFRVIFYNSADMQTAITLLTGADDFINSKPGGNIAGDDKSKNHGYRAIHFDLKLNSEKRLQLEEYKMLIDLTCEVQFKTIFAHAWSKVYHTLSYKQMDGMKLQSREQGMLNDDFKEAAKNLEQIEQYITELCTKYFAIEQVNPNGN